MLIRKASPDEAGHAVAIWREVATWLRDSGRGLWDPSQFLLREAETLAEGGELVLGFGGSWPAACMTLQPLDPVFWPEAEGAALYLHKLAVRRPCAGHGWGVAMIEWAAEEARRQGVATLRLDCAPRPELVRLYLQNGFRCIDPHPVRLGGFEVVRFQRQL